MTYMKHTLTVCLGSLVLALLGACSSDNEVPQPGKEEGHRVDIVLSGSPAAARTVGTGTRALVVTGNPAQVHPELENPRSVQQILNPYLDDMAIGSTVRLLVWPAVKNKTDSKWERMPNTAPLNCTFVVRGDADTHFYYLRPCSVKADGSFDKEVGTPLILRDGDWIIYAASPALPLDDNAGLKLTNGHKTERLQNEFISSVDLLNAGIQVNGLQPPVYYSGGYSMNYTDTLQTTWGKKGESLILLNKYITPVRIRHQAQDGSDSIVTYRAFNVMADILPTDATSHPLNILFSGVVNGVPANFSYNLNEKVFRPGYYYHYLGKIDIKEGVVVVDWGSNSWEADVDLNYNESQYEDN